MPCMGPGPYSKEKADAAYEETVKLLAEKYGQLKFPLSEHEKYFWAKDREKVFSALRKAVHDIFELETFEGF